MFSFAPKGQPKENKATSEHPLLASLPPQKPEKKHFLAEIRESLGVRDPKTYMEYKDKKN
jgi:hypothetical protein